MAQCWRLTGLSSTEKLVLIALADQSDEEGYCWPSVATIAERTCLADRSVQRSIQSLVDRGILTVDKSKGGRTNSYLIQANGDTVTPLSTNGDTQSPRHSDTVTVTHSHPRQAVTPTHGHRNGDTQSPNGDTVSPKPSITIIEPPQLVNKREAKPEKPKKAKTDAVVVDLPDWMPADRFAAFVKNRADLGKHTTAEAQRLLVRDLAKFHDAGHDVGDIINTSISRGWAGVFEPKQAAVQRARPPVDDWLPPELRNVKTIEGIATHAD